MGKVEVRRCSERWVSPVCVCIYVCVCNACQYQLGIDSGKNKLARHIAMMAASNWAIPPDSFVSFSSASRSPLNDEMGCVYLC